MNTVRWPRLAWAGLICTTLCTPPARADDSFFAIGAGGLVFRHTGAVAMQSEDLFISPSEVRVRYEMRNDRKTPVSGRVAFPLPPFLASIGQYQWTPVPTDATPGFMRFTLTVNGRQQPTTMRVWATAGGRDVTAALQQAGYDVRTRPVRPPLGPTLFPTRDLPRLRALHAVDVDGPDVIGHWETHVTYEWRQTFPPGVTIIEHRYTPLPGGAYDPGTTPPLLGSYGAEHCIGPPALADLAARLKDKQTADPNAMAWMTFVSFILKTAQNWHGPIGTLHVALQAGPEDQVATCARTLHFAPTAPGRLEATASNWTAREDIDAMFVSVDKPGWAGR